MYLTTYLARGERVNEDKRVIGLVMGGLVAIGLVACQDQDASDGAEMQAASPAMMEPSAVRSPAGMVEQGDTAVQPLPGVGMPASPQPAPAAPMPQPQPSSTPADQPVAGDGPEATVPASDPGSEPAPDPAPAGPPAPDPEPPAEPPTDLEPFSFFVTSLEIMRELSGSPDGFGGDLGGLEGADSICQQAAERVGFGAKTWRAFLSVTDGGDGQPIHAIDRIGDGPWYDRNGRLIAEDRAGLLNERPAGDEQTVDDLPNEHGEGLKAMGDTHDILTGTNPEGQVAATDPVKTCNDWTSTTVSPSDGSGGRGSGGVQLGHAWPAGSGRGWMTAHTVGSCEAGVNLVQGGGGGGGVGALGGYGGIYCFALTP